MSDLPTDVQAGDPDHLAHHNALHERYNESGGVRFVTLDFEFDTPDLVTVPGLRFATMAPGELILFISLSLTELFDGTTPFLHARCGDTDPYSGTDLFTFAADDFTDAPQGSEMDIVVFQYPGDVYAPNAAPPDLFLLLNDAADVTVPGNDPGSTQGRGRIGVMLLANAGRG